MRKGIVRTGDVLYAGLFGVLVALGIWTAGDVLAAALGAQGFALDGWNAFIVAGRRLWRDRHYARYPVAPHEARRAA